MSRLTDASLRALPGPETGIKIYFDDTIPGFGVRCSQGGAKAFVLTFGVKTARRRVTIGRYPTIGLSEARTAARRLLAEQTLGKHRAPRMTYSQALVTFLEDKGQRNRSRTMKDTVRILNKYFEPIQNKNLEDITTYELTKITDKLARETPGTARHVFAEGRAFFRWCVKRRYIQHSPLEGLDPPAPSRTRERVLSDDELRVVWKAADAIDGHSGIIVKLLLLTGQRRGEIGALRAEWLGLNNKTCQLPSEITKNKRSHTFPLGSFSTLIITTLCPVAADSHSGTGLLFPARGKSNQQFNGWSKAKAQLDKRVDILWRDINQNASPFTSWTLHDLRRTYATNLQRLDIKLEVIEALLNHISGTRAGIVGVYQRHRYWEEMRQAVTTYEAWLQKTIIQP